MFYAPVTLPDDLPSGEYFVGMELDFTNIIDESNEDDNWRIDADKLVLAGPVEIDLASSDVVASENAVKVGAATSVAVTVDNLGPDAVGPYSVRFYYSADQNITNNDVLLCTVQEAGLAANGSTVVQDQCVVPNLNGDYYLGAIVDPGNLIAETNEDNNAAFDPALVSIAPLEVDITPTAVTSSSYTVDVGDLINFSANVTNNGPDPSPAFSLRFYYSTDANITTNDTLICQQDGPALQPGASSPVNKNCAVPPLATGNYRLGVIVDPTNAIGETNEANNAAINPNAVSITAPNVDLAYDYHGDDLNFFAEPGDQFTYDLDVWNHGTDASPSFEATMVWSIDSNISLADVEGCTIELPSIPAQTKFHYEFMCSVPELPPGAYYSGAIIDPSNAVPETNEGNNKGVSLDPQQIQ
jgi:subtilase family serine protease